MRLASVASILLSILVCNVAGTAQAKDIFAGEKKLNNLVSELLVASTISTPGGSFPFARSNEGWIFISATHRGKGTASLILDDGPTSGAMVVRGTDGGGVAEAMRLVAKGEHTLRVDVEGEVTVDYFVVRAIPELIHCGLFDPAIESYGPYDMEFLRKDLLPNITGLIAPQSVILSQAVIDDWHRQGKKLVALTGVDREAKTSNEHFKHWTSVMDACRFADGIIIDEFGINNPPSGPDTPITPERQSRLERQQQRHKAYEEAFKQIRADARYKDKTVYAYFGGSAKKLYQETLGPTFIRTLIDLKYPVALERYLFERSSEAASKDALQEFCDGIADWEAKEPGAKKNMLLSLGLFSSPPGGINKLPNVDYHVWMDQQMNVVANNPVMAEMGGINWWTSSQADEETVRFVGKLYRHYGIEGKTEMLTQDPLFLTHIQNADFESGVKGWTLQAAEAGSIEPMSFPRYGRIEGRYMGLGRPADPEHIGDTFLVMKRSEKGPNAFSQTVKDLQPGRLYSMKMLTCDYRDLTEPKNKTMEEASKFMGKVVLEGVEVDTKQSFNERYASNPEPTIPIWITYHWIVFRAKTPTATLIVSDWESDKKPEGEFGQEQTFNFLEIEPYYE